jgi:hypothetical protein
VASPATAAPATSGSRAARHPSASRSADEPPDQIPLEAQLDGVDRLQPDDREGGDDRCTLEDPTGAQHHRAGPVHGDEPAVPLVTGHDRRDGVLAHTAGQLVVTGDEQDAVGR